MLSRSLLVCSSDFMKFKGVPFKEMSKASEVKDTLPIVRQAATKDRELMEKVPPKAPH